MSVTPQLKDKVEFSLDNRQIFFLFFGLSVVGCFVFAMGVMVGKRGEIHELPAVAQEDSIVLLDDDPVVADNGYSFKDGLQRPATDGLPATRDPAVAPRDEDTVRAERDAALGSKSTKKPGSSKKLPAIPAAAAPKAGSATPKGMPALGGAEEPVAKESTAKEPKLPAAIVEKPAADSVLAAVKGEAAVADSEPRAGKRFTLQMKAFASQDDAGKLADKLRRNGHEVRVESGEANGRMWHRVRMGEFQTWDAAVAAKQAFEKNEQVIAYVVSL
jgi:septal ring-binding cell division protein DamX